MNLKKHGLLALTLDDSAIYEQALEGAHVSILELEHLAPGRPVPCLLRQPDGTTLSFTCHHTLDDEQLEWSCAGSSLNRTQQDNLVTRIAGSTAREAPFGSAAS